MRIEEMYPLYIQRRETKLSILKMRLNDVVIALENAVDQIPEDTVYQVIDEVVEGYPFQEDDLFMGLYMHEDRIVFSPSEYNVNFYKSPYREFKEEVNMDDIIRTINNLNEFIYSEYHRRFSFVSFVWEIRLHVSATINFRFPINVEEKKST